MLASSRKDLPYNFGLVKKRIYLNTHLKEKLTDFFLNYQGIPYSHRQNRKRMVNTLLMVNTTPICKRLFREQIYAVYSFLSYAKKKIQTWFVSLASREYFGIKPTTFLSTLFLAICKYIKIPAKYFLHHHQKIIKHFLWKAYAVL